MKSVLISIQPKWCEKIASGEKTIEVRKSRPKIETPFKCYIYETKDKKYENMGIAGFKKSGGEYVFVNHIGKVIGEFVCDRIEEYAPALFNGQDFYQNFGVSEEIKTCLSLKEVCEYGKGKPLYGWQISNLKIYDKPKEVKELRKPCCFSHSCSDCNEFNHIDKYCLRRATVPQSWCYVEDLGE